VTIRRAVVFSNVRDRDRDTRRRLKTELDKRGIAVVQQDADLVISIGGDGTFLEAVRRYRDLGVPFVGVNTGSLGFLQEVDQDHIDELAANLASGQYTVDHYPLLRTRVHSVGGVTEMHALNDVVVERRGTRTIRVQLTIDGYDCGKVLGDGIIVAAPVGSTAYASAAGGAIVHPKAPVYQVVPLSPHDSQIYQSIRTALILPPESRVRITMDPEKVRDARVVIDGAEIDVEGMRYTELDISDKTLPVLKFGESGYWRRLFTKILGVNVPELGNVVPGENS